MIVTSIRLWKNASLTFTRSLVTALNDSVGRKVAFVQSSGLPQIQVDNLFEKFPTLLYVGTRRVHETIELLQTLQINIDEIVDHPQIFSVPLSTVQCRYDILKELGFVKIGLRELLRYRWLMQLDIENLQNLGYSKEGRLSEWLTKLHIPDEVFNKIKRNPTSFQASKLEEIHKTLIVKYISSILNITDSDASMIIRKYPSVAKQTLQSLMATLNTLTTRLNIYPEKIKMNPYLLTTKPEHVVKIMRSIPKLGGISIKELIHMCPRILCKTPQDIMKCWKNMHHFGITEQQLRTFPHVLLYSSTTIQSRLREIFKIPELFHLKHDRAFLRLVYQFPTIQQRHEHLKKEGALAFSVSSLTASNEKFQRIALNSYTWRKAVPIIAEKLGMSKTLVVKSIKRHPKFCYLHLKNSLDVLETLQRSGYTSKQILNAIALTLYSNDLVVKKILDLRGMPELQPFHLWKNHDNILQIVLYFLERDGNFSSDLVDSFKPKLNKKV